MQFNKKYLVLIPALLLAGFIGCSDDDDNGGDNNNNVPANNNNNVGGNDNNNNDTGPTLADCAGENGLQAQGCQNGQIQFYVIETATTNPALAVIGLPDGFVPQIPLPTDVETDDSAAGPEGTLEANNFFGAVNPDGSDNWWAGWTYIDSDVDGGLPGDDFHPLQAEIETGTITPAATNGCAGLGGGATYADGGTVDVFGEAFPVCVVSGRLTADSTWPNNHVFLLDGTFNIGNGDAMGATATDGPTLTIEAGTQIYAIDGSFTTFVVTRGAEVNATGTAAMPIIFGAVEANPANANAISGDVTDLSGRGEWGGIAMSGFGRVASATALGGEVSSEAAPPDAARFFGGNDNSDSSGTLAYVIIAETGFPFAEGEEIQGLTVEGAGKGTDLRYIQVIGSEDDGIEWFGGAAGAKYLVISGVQDDGLDQDDGYKGVIQYAIVIIGSENGERGLEFDGSDDLALPFDVTTNPVLANVTIIGDVGFEGSDSSGILNRTGWQGQIWRAAVLDGAAAFERGCLDVDDDANTLETDIAYRDGLFNCSNGQASGLVDDDDM